MRIIDIFVRDRNGRPLNNVHIAFTVDGQAAGYIPSSEGRGRIELPDRVSVVSVTARYDDEAQTAKLSQNQDSFTFKFGVDPMVELPPKNHPDLIDAFIVILIAAAVDIFIFWMATQFIQNPAFQNLPSFVTDTYTAIWTSTLTGTAGIGAAIVKAFTRKPGQHAPNYLLYVLLTALGFFVAIVVLAYVSTTLTQPQPKSQPKQESEQKTAPQPLPVVVYKICSGEYERACLTHDIYQYCGFNVQGWADARCTSSTIVRLDSRDGNKCGYDLHQVICTGPK